MNTLLVRILISLCLGVKCRSVVLVVCNPYTFTYSGSIRGLTGSAVEHRSLASGFKSWLGCIRWVFHLLFHLLVHSNGILSVYVASIMNSVARTLKQPTSSSTR